MTTSYNGWSASPSQAIRPLVINGIAFVPGIRDDDNVEAVFRYVLTEYAKRVEPLVNPGCWGFNYRANANDPNSLSNHSSATAVDVNAPQHPNGVPTRNTFSAAQIAEVHQILAEVDHVLRWGGDYTSTPDAMHFEINATYAEVAAVAARLTNKGLVMDKEVTAAFQSLHDHLDRFAQGEVARDRADYARMRQLIADGRTAKKSAEQILAAVEAEADAPAGKG